ncbi:hypothetical protein BGZ70_009024 [Mortierella alpina]|uniref:Uncharacterized protein n=1 Tax=Mortierella alpina TaxID=64518 RepID=A0A9P6M7G7_MORAP|nr:hypothetical protein BGZ70_009024 [Mortierella alpina]
MGPPLSRTARSPLSLARPSFAYWALSAILVAVTILPTFTHADITCNTFKDTFRVGDTLKFVWNDTQSYIISNFNLDLYCVETGKLVCTLATLNTNTSEPTVEWTVDDTIQAGAAECPRHQYSASFDWHYSDPTTLEAKVGTGSCNRIMLFIPPATTSSAATPDQDDPANTDDRPPDRQIFISDKTKTIIIGVGGAVGALILAGFFGFYFIRCMNRRAEEAAANRKLREPLHASSVEEGGSSGSLAKNKHDNGDGTRYSALSSVTTTLPGDKMELDPMGSSYSTASGASASRSGSHLPMMTERTSQEPPLSSTRATMRHSMQSGMSGPPASFTNERPTSLLTSSFTPPTEDEQRRILRTRQREEQERQHYEEQLQQQQQQQQQHQQQQQQQQQNFGSYPF